MRERRNLSQLKLGVARVDPGTSEQRPHSLCDRTEEASPLARSPSQAPSNYEIRVAVRTIDALRRQTFFFSVPLYPVPWRCACRYLGCRAVRGRMLDRVAIRAEGPG